MKSKNIVKNVIAVLIAIIAFVIFSMTRFSDDVNYLVGYFKFQMLRKNELVNIKREPIRKIKNADDVKGFWKSDGIAFEKRYEALIDNDSIIIYKYDISDGNYSGDDNKNIYWLGTFNFENVLAESTYNNKVNDISTNSTNESKQSNDNLELSEDIFNNLSNDNQNSNIKITSKNYSQVSKYLSTASQRENMEFLFNDGEITFTSQYNDDLYKVKLRPYIPYTERIRMIKYNNDRKEGYNENTNKEIILDNYKIQYPSYFDTEEDNSRRDIPDNWVYNAHEGMKEKNLIILSPSNTKSFAELFVGEYGNTNINSYEELKDYIIYNNKNYSIDDSELVTYAFNNENNSIMHIFTTRYYDEYTGKVIYSLAFENWILMKDTNKIINIGVSYTNDDTSEYDYIGDYESIIKNIKIIK